MSTWIDQDGRRHVGVMVNGKRAHRRLPEGATARDAKQVEAELTKALGRQRPVSIPGDPPMMHVLALYVDHAEKNLRSPDTAIHHAKRTATWAKNYRASEAMQMAAQMVGDMSPHYKPATINKSIGVLKTALSLAWHGGLVPENYGSRVHRLPENNRREVIPTVNDVRAIADLCGPQAQAVIWMALMTGSRRGEVCKIDPALHVHGDRLEIPASHTKTLRTKSIPITPPIRALLASFPVGITADGVKSAFRRARVRAGRRHINFHDLRHACASLLIQAGEDLYIVKEVLGHSSITSTQRYTHLQLDKKRQALDKLGAAITAGITPEIAPQRKTL